MKKFLNNLFFLGLLFFSNNVFAMECESLQTKCLRIVDESAQALARDVIGGWPDVEGLDEFLNYPEVWQNCFLEKLKFYAGERWPIQTGMNFLPSQRLEGCTKYVISVQISFDGKMIISGSHDKKIRIFLLGDDGLYYLHQTLDDHRDWITSVVITPDRNTILSTSRDGTIKIWVLQADGFYHLHQSINQNLCCVDTAVISLDNQMIISGCTIGSFDQFIRIWTRGEDGLCGWNQEIHEQALGHLSIAMSSDKRVFVCGFIDRTVKIFRLQEDGRYLEVQEFKENHTNIRHVAMSEDGQMIVYGGPDIPVKVLILRDDGQYHLNQELKSVHDGSSWFDCIYMSPDKKMIVSGFNNEIIEVNLLGRDGLYFLLSRFGMYNNCISGVCMSLDKKVIVSSSEDVIISRRHSALDALNLPETLDFLRAHCS